MPTCVRPRSSAVSDTASGSAAARQPPSSVAARSLARPKPRATAQAAPRDRICFSSADPSFGIAPVRPDAGGDRLEERVGDALEVRRQLVRLEPGAQQPDAAVDVVADAARGDGPLVGVDGRDAADREPVAPVDVGHRERMADDAGQMGDVRHLLQRGVVAQHGHQLLAGVHASRDQHPAVAGDLPHELVDAPQLHQTSRITRARQPSAVRVTAS